MIRADNLEILNIRFPMIYKLVKDHEAISYRTPYVLEKSRRGDPTLSVRREDDETVYLHSKYDPVQEAERFVSQLQDTNEYEHFFFYGIGLGYHIQALMKMYPQKRFTLYEPELGIFYRYLETHSLNNLPQKQLSGIYLETTSDDRRRLLNDFAQRINERVLFISLPSYERIFYSKFKDFSKKFTQIISARKMELNVNSAFEKRWTLNSLYNFQNVICTQNILEKMEYFANCPIILVSAGPSLNQDLPRIAEIKEKGSAYIFSVGSAVNTLVKYGIIPDAACAYVPSHTSINVFKQIIEDGQDTFPLIFGSSVGYEVVRRFKGPKLHMIISQDAFAQYCLRYSDGTVPGVINDTSTIALVTLQVLYRLGCKFVVLVGQNLAYLNEMVYADGIRYSHISSVVTESMRETALTVEDVYGGQVNTSKSFNNMRLQMENFIKGLNGMTIINSTKGGAKIRGAEFIPLEEVIATRLREKVVDSKWYLSPDGAKRYDRNYIMGCFKRLSQSRIKLEDDLKKANNALKTLEELSKTQNEKQLELTIQSFDRIMKRITENEFYHIFLMPMERIAFEFLSINISDIRFETDIKKKVRLVIVHFGKLISNLKKDLELVDPVFMSNSKTVLDGV